MNTRPLFRCLLAAVLFSGCVLAMSTGSTSHFHGQGPGAVYKGIWKGQCKGRVFVLLTLTPDDDGGSLKGTIAIGDIGVDENGEVNEVTAEAKDAVAISDVNLNEDVLTFKGKTDNYRMKLAGTDRAKLQVEGAPSNVKPFTLERAAGHE
jgi:hypothetical protein